MDELSFLAVPEEVDCGTVLGLYLHILVLLLTVLFNMLFTFVGLKRNNN